MTFAPLKIAMKTTNLKRLAVLSMAVAGIVGCDDRGSANKAVLQKIDAGLAKLASVDGLSPSDGLTAAKTDLTDAAKETSANPAFVAVASASIAGVDQQAAVTAIAKLNTLEGAVRGTIAQMRALADQVALSNQYAVGYSLEDPKTAVSQLAGDISSMQGNAQALTWAPTDQTTSPTLAAVKQEISRLQGDISQRQQQIQDLTRQRADAVALSDQKLKEADTLKGDDAVKVFGEGSDARRKADDVAIEIDLAQSQLMRSQADLALQQTQQDAINGGITTLQSQGESIETSWADLQKHAAAQTAIATAIVDGDDQTKVTIKDLSAQLAKQLDAVKQQRSAILDQFTEAEKYFGSARDDATKFGQSIQSKLSGTSKEVADYRALREAVHPQRYELQRANVQRDSGAVLLTEAALLSEVDGARTSMQTILDAAKLQMPTELASLDASASKQLMDDAETRLTDASNTFTNVESGDAPDATKNAAKIGLLIAMQNHLSLYDLRQAAGDASAKQAADQLMSDATALKNDIVTAGLSLPALPGALGTPPAPATQPSDGTDATTPAAAPAATPAPAMPATPAPK